MKKLLQILFTSSIFFLLTTNTINAQASLDLTISPPISYLHVPQGTSRTHTIVIENNNDHSVVVTPKIVDFSSNGKTGQAIISNTLSFPYIKLDEKVTTLTIPAHKKAQLTLYIDIPNNEEDKEYPLTVLFFTKNDKTTKFTSSQNDSFSQISGAVGSNLIVLVSKDNKLNNVLKINNINTPLIIDSFTKLKFIPLVTNNSLASQTASGSAKIFNWKKQTVAEFEIYPDMILGNNSRELRALINTGVNQVPNPTNFSYKPRFLFGPYKIVVTLNNSEKYIKVIYAFPLWGTLIVILGVVIIVVYTKKNKPISNN